MTATRPKDRTALAAAIIANGKPYSDTQPVEGNAESGPYALTYVGYRWGQLRLEKAENGSWWIMRDGDRADGYPALWASLPSPYRSGDFRLRRVARAVGFRIDAGTLLKATRAERSALGRRLTPDHHVEVRAARRLEVAA